MRKIFLVSFALIIVPSLLLSQTRTKHVELSFDMSRIFLENYFKVHGMEYDGSEWNEREIQAQDDYSMGAAIAYHFNPKWGIGFSYDDVSTEGGGARGIDIDLELFELYAIRSFRADGRKFTPFIMGGIGRMDFSAGTSLDNFSFKVLDLAPDQSDPPVLVPVNQTREESAKGEYLMLGGGCKIFTSKRIGLNFGGKFYITGGEKSKHFLEPDPQDPSTLIPLSPPVDMMAPDLLKGSNSLSLKLSFGVTILTGKQKAEE